MHTNLKDKLKVLRLAVRKEYFYEIINITSKDAQMLFTD